MPWRQLAVLVLVVLLGLVVSYTWSEARRREAARRPVLVPGEIIQPKR